MLPQRQAGAKLFGVQPLCLEACGLPRADARQAQRWRGLASAGPPPEMQPGRRWQRRLPVACLPSAARLGSHVPLASVLQSPPPSARASPRTRLEPHRDDAPR